MTKDIVEIFFEALSAPKNNLTKEYLAGGMSHPPGIMGVEKNEGINDENNI
jgi:hypothetical protein